MFRFYTVIHGIWEDLGKNNDSLLRLIVGIRGIGGLPFRRNYPPIYFHPRKMIYGRTHFDTRFARTHRERVWIFLLFEDGCRVWTS